MNKAVFLDRDGVNYKAIIRNEKQCPPYSLDELELIPDVQESLQKLKSKEVLSFNCDKPTRCWTGNIRQEICRVKSYCQKWCLG